MSRFRVRPFLAALLSCVGLALAVADDRTEPIDFMVALDRSLSMRQEIGAVKQYVDTQIVDQILQPGDTFIVIAFWGQNQLAVFENLTAASDRATIKQTIDGLAPKEAFTDIGFALDRLRDTVRSRCNPTHKKTLLLITDAIDEPPPGSMYTDPGSWRGHEYMRVTSETQKEGWKIIVLGVGEQPPAPAAAAPAAPGAASPTPAPGAGPAAGPTAPSSVQQLAKDLGGQYVAGGATPTAETLARIMPDLIGRMTLEGISVTPMARSGSFEAVLSVKTDGYGAQPQLWIQSVSFKGEGTSGPVSLEGLLAQPVILPMPLTGLTEVHLQLKAAQPPSAGRYPGTFEFAFGGNDQFPATQPVELRVNSLVAEYPWALPVAALVLAAVVALVLVGVAAAGTLRVRLLVEEKPLPQGKDVFRLRKGKDAYLRESRDRFDIADARTPKTIARLVASKRGGPEVALSRVKPDRFPEMDDDERNVLDGRYVVRSETGGTYHLRFERVP